MLLLKVIALYKFDGERASDLPFGRGEILDVIGKPEDGWWIARNVLSLTGLIPRPYIKIVSALFIGEGFEQGSYFLNGGYSFNPLKTIFWRSFCVEFFKYLSSQFCLTESRYSSPPTE